MSVDTVTLHPVRVEGDRVTWTWADPDRPGGEAMITYRYEGIDCSQFSTELWLEIWLGLQLREYTKRQTPLRIVLPAPIPQPSHDFWMAYYRNPPNVEIGPISPATTYSPFRKRQPNIDPYSAGVYFGGGRDSLTAAALLGDWYGRERVLLMTAVDPTSETKYERVDRRFEELMLQPARDAGFAVQRVETNFRGLRTHLPSGSTQPHLEQYTLAFLPVLLAKGVPLSTFCYAWFQYVFSLYESGPAWSYAQSRPEMLAMQSRHYQRVLGFDHQVADLNMVFSAHTAFQILADQFADLIPNLYMCQNAPIGQRWCYGMCGKCSLYSRYLMALQVEDPSFDLDRMWSRSPFIHKLMASINTISEAPPPGRNAPWLPGLHSQYLFGNTKNAYYLIDPDFARRHLGDDAFVNLMVVKSLFGQEWDAAWERVPQQAFAGLPAKWSSRLRPLVERFNSIGEHTLETPLSTANEPVYGPFAMPFTHPLLELPHLQ